MSCLFEAWKPVGGARVTGIIMAETSVYFVVKMSFWTFVMCQVKSSENLEGMSPGGLLNRGKKTSIHYINWVVLQRTLACGTHYGIGMLCLTEAGEQQID